MKKETLLQAFDESKLSAILKYLNQLFVLKYEVIGLDFS